jgi:hypothetical protein
VHAEAEAHRRFRQALGGSEATDALFQLAKVLITEGWSQHELYRLFTWYQQRVSPEDPAYDAVVDNLDLIDSGPWAKGHGLFPSELNDAAAGAPSPFRRPWVLIFGDPSELEAEAQREIPPGHVLWERRLVAIARREDCDDVLFAIRGTPEVCLIHLTWSQRREAPGFPDTSCFPTMLDWCDAHEDTSDP